jgi:hypothetical protein
MNKLETVLFVATAAVTFGVTYYLWEFNWWIFFILILSSLNILFNGSNYRNKSYYLISFILYVVIFPIGTYYLAPGDFKYLSIIALFFMGIIWFYGYNERENSSKPWRNEW